MLHRIINYFRPPPLVSMGELERFLGAEAAYLAQRSTYEFCRNTLSYFGQHMFGDDGFNAAFRHCRWEAFAAILADLTLLAAAELRRAAPPGVDVNAAALELFARNLAAYEVPAHRPDGWGDTVAELRRRLGDQALAPPQTLARLVAVSTRRVFEVLPVYSHNRAADFEGIEAAIRFGTVAAMDRLRQRLRPAAILGT